MTEQVRCPACRGSKKVAKLGGIIGECNTCKGEGKINQIDKPVPVKIEPLPITDAVIKATAEAVPVTIEKNTELLHNDKFVVEVMDAAPVIQQAPKEGNVSREQIQAAVKSVSASKVDPKKAIYKRKKA